MSTTTRAAGAASARSRAARIRRGGSAARWRVATRLAHRQVRRTPLSSLLIVVLILLPIAAMTGFTVISYSTVPTPAEEADVELGQMQGWGAGGGIPDAGFWQHPSQPDFNGYPADADGAITEPVGTPLGDPASLLPAGTEAIPLAEGQVAVKTANGVATVPAFAGSAWDPRFGGRFDLVDGRAPSNDHEAMTTTSALSRIGIGIGNELVLSDGGEAFTVVGTLDAAPLPDDAAAVFLPEGARVSGGTQWYLPTLKLSWRDVQVLNDKGAIAYSREVVLDPPDPRDTEVYPYGTGDSMAPVLMLLGIAGAFAAYVAVAARRQQRSLAVAASVGANPSDLRRTILLQGAVLGLVGGIAGIALGIGAAAAVMAILSNGSATQF